MHAIALPKYIFRKYYFLPKINVQGRKSSVFQQVLVNIGLNRISIGIFLAFNCSFIYLLITLKLLRVFNILLFTVKREEISVSGQGMFSSQNVS